MRDWLSNLPLVGAFFHKEVPEERRLVADTNPQLNAERERSRQLAAELARVRESEKALKSRVESLESDGASNAEKLAALEEMLGDPDRAQNAIVYHQLRAIWFACNGEIRTMVRELARNMEQEERNQLLSRFRTRQEEESRHLRDTEKTVIAERDELLEKRRGLERDLRRAGRIWHFLKRRRLQAELSSVEAALAPVEKQREDIRQHMKEVQDREAPAYDGLSIEAKRHINVAAIALAQYLYLRFRSESVADMARSARRKPVHEAYFGPAEECLKIMRQLREVEGRWRTDRERPEKVRRRSRHLAGVVRFSEEGQTVPDMRSVDHLHPSISSEGGNASGDTSPLPINVLELDLWDIRNTLF